MEARNFYRDIQDLQDVKGSGNLRFSPKGGEAAIYDWGTRPPSSALSNSISSVLNFSDH